MEHSCTSADSKREMMELQQKKVDEKLSHIKEKILILSGKGGVGKSTIAVNLSVALSNRKYKVGLFDADFHGPSIPNILGIKGFRIQTKDNEIVPYSYSENLKAISIEGMLENLDDAVIWRGPMKMGVIKQLIGDVDWGDLDYFIIDSPPGTGDEPLSVAQTIIGAKAIIVTTPQEVSLSDVRKSINFCKRVGMPIIGLIENMSGFICPKCGEKWDIFKSGTGESTAKKMKIEFLGAIPIDMNVVTLSDTGKPFINYYQGNISKVFEDIVDKITK